MNSNRKSQRTQVVRDKNLTRAQIVSSDPSRPSAMSRPNPARDHRLLLMFGLALIGAALAIGAIVLLTPSEGELADTDSVVNDGQLKSNQSSALTLSQPTSSSVGPRRVPPRHFPEVEQEIDVDGLHEELRQLARTLETDYPEAAISLHFAAQIHVELKQTKLAEVAWRKCIEQGVEAPGPYAGLSEILASSGREQEAIDLLLAAHDKGVKSRETFLRLAESQENIGLLEDSRATLEQAIADYPDDAAAWLARGRVLNQLQQYAGAEESAKKSIELAGDSEKSLFVLSTALVRQKKMDEVAMVRERLQQLRSATEQKNDGFQNAYESALRNIAVELLLSSSDLAFANGHPLEAESYAWRAVELSPKNGQAYMSLAAIMRSQKRLYEAFDVQQQLVKIQPENTFNYVNLASVAMQVGDIKVAKQALQTGVRLEPTGGAAQDSLIRLHMALGEYDDAKRVAVEFLGQRRSVEAYVLLANVLSATGEKQAAEDALSQARLLDPNHPVWLSQ